MDDHALAATAAKRAGEVLLALRRSPGADATPADLGARGDAAAHARLIAELQAHRPDDVVLSEEAADDPVRLDAERVWIIDPLDGTREYTEGDRTDWAVHVALWSDDRLTAGAVAIPALGQCLSTGEPFPPLHDAEQRPRVAISRTRAPAAAEALCEVIGGRLVRMGSAGAKAMAVARGEADVYLHAGGQYEWDSAAPVAVALAAGLHASRLDGSPLVYNQPNPWLPDVLVCHPQLAQRVLAFTSTRTDLTTTTPPG